MKIKMSEMRRIIKEESDKIKELEDALKRHDWYYEMSDDHRYWKNGTREKKEIYELMTQVDRKVAEKLWNKYRPDAKMFPFPKNFEKQISILAKYS